MIKKIFTIFFVLAIFGVGWIVVTSLLDSNEEVASEDSISSFTDFEEASNSDVDNFVLNPNQTTDFSAGVVVLKSKNNTLVTSQGNFDESDVSTLADGFSKLFEEENNVIDESFAIFYDESSNKMTVYLFTEPLSRARNEVTNLLMERLNMTSEELCNLDIPVQTNEYVNVEYANYLDLGLSFCPGSVILE